MQILLNGKPHELPNEITVAVLIEELKMGGKRLAIELNGEILPRSQYAEKLLTHEDQLEIVQAIGGGAPI